MILPKLQRRQAAGNPIKVGWVGAGRMITGAICQTALMQGMRNAVICDIRPEAALRAHTINGVKKEDIVVTNQAAQANDAIRAGKPVVTEDAKLLPQLELDCIVEGTGVPEVGAEVAFRSIQAGKNIIMLNVETDVVIGPLLHQLAERAGVIYSVSSGDEPGLITELVDRYQGLGFEIVAVGKTPPTLAKLDLYATPDTVGEDARAMKINPHFLVTFRDATKTAIEMSSIANATGLIPDIRGMHGPVAGIYDMAKKFRLKSEGGILDRRGVVDYARPLMLDNGEIDYVNSVTPGVFVVIRAPHPQVVEDLYYLKVIGEGDYFLMYTPYHLVTNEIPLSIVWAVEDKEPTVVPRFGHLTEIIGKAKKDMRAGETLDAGGGFTVYGVNDLAAITKRENCVPMGLLDGAKLTKNVERDQVITYDAVELKTDTMLYQLRKLQDATIPPTERSRD
ncbi:MAG: NAD(P)H-dependent oxidoreductase [Chloroflexota bacterium]